MLQLLYNNAPSELLICNGIVFTCLLPFWRSAAISFITFRFVWTVIRVSSSFSWAIQSAAFATDHRNCQLLRIPITLMVLAIVRTRRITWGVCNMTNFRLHTTKIGLPRRNLLIIFKHLFVDYALDLVCLCCCLTSQKIFNRLVAPSWLTEHL